MSKQQLQNLLRLAKLVALRCSAVFLQIAAQLLLGRFVGGYGVGLFQLVSTWVCLLGETSSMGLPTRALRVASSDLAEQRYLQYCYAKRSMAIIACVWALLFGLSSLIRIYAPGFLPFTREAESLYWVVMVGALGFAQMRLMADVLKAQAKTGFAVFVESAGPVMGLLLATILGIALSSLNPLILVAAYSAGFVITALIFLASLRSNIPRQADEQTSAEDNALTRVSIDKELFALAGSGLVNIMFISFPFIVLPLITSVAEIGVFSVAFKLVNLISTVLIMLAAVYGPLFAVAAKRSSGAELHQILFRTQLVSCLLYMPALFTLLAFPEEILALFGPEFVAAQPFLMVLLIGQCVNAMTGLPGVLLNMSGHGKTELACSLTGLLVAAAGASLQFNSLDAYSVAVIYSAALIVKNVASYSAARIVIYQQQKGASSSYPLAGSTT